MPWDRRPRRLVHLLHELGLGHEAGRRRRGADDGHEAPEAGGEKLHLQVPPLEPRRVGVPPGVTSRRNDGELNDDGRF